MNFAILYISITAQPDIKSFPSPALLIAAYNIRDMSLYNQFIREARSSMSSFLAIPKSQRLETLKKWILCIEIEHEQLEKKLYVHSMFDSFGPLHKDIGKWRDYSAVDMTKIDLFLLASGLKSLYFQESAWRQLYGLPAGDLSSTISFKELKSWPPEFAEKSQYLFAINYIDLLSFELPLMYKTDRLKLWIKHGMKRKYQPGLLK